MSTISVALCTYNGSQFLRQQLCSIAAQGRLPDELVVCDDGSGDDTVAILKEFARSVPFPVRLVQNPQRLGAAANFSKAISLCGCDIIVLSDQDDVWNPGKLQCLEAVFDRDDGAGGWFSDAELIDQNGNGLGRNLWGACGFGAKKQSAVRRGSVLDLLIQGNFVTGATMAFRARWRDCLLPVPEGWIHDYWIAVLLAALTRLEFSGRALIQYRCHDAQQLGVRKQHWSALITEKIDRLDRKTYETAADNWNELVRRLHRCGSHGIAEVSSKCESAADHFSRRASLPSNRFSRLPIIAKEVCNGNYFRYSLGIKSILRDLAANGVGA